MSSRVTRSSARLAESSPATSSDTQTSSQKPSSSKKRKAPGRNEASPSRADASETPFSAPSTRWAKRQKITDNSAIQRDSPTLSTRSTRRRGTNIDTAMSGNGYEDWGVDAWTELTRTRSSSKSNDDAAKASKSTAKKPSSQSAKKSGRSVDRDTSAQAGHSNSADPTTSNDHLTRKQKRKNSRKESDVHMHDDSQSASRTTKPEEAVTPPPPPDHDNQDQGDHSPDGQEENEEDSFAAAIFGRGAPAGLSTTLRALSGMMSGMSSRLRDILNNLRQVDNPTMQLIALEELSNLLLVSNEDNLSGQFSPDPYVKELVALMQPNPITGEENPEIMLLACRCIANLMEALRGSVANVVYGGAVPVLCQKLLDIQYIDVAEQALSTLSKVSIDFPASIVREGGLTACLQFLDFFATGTQRTAVTTAANCCRNIPHESFPVIRDVMPILQNVLVSHDQKVVEQGSLCVTRIVDSFKRSPEKLEQLVDPPLLQAVLGLLLPGTTNLIGPSIHTEFLRVLATVARASPRLATELLKMNIVDTLYQVLTGVSPPDETADAASKIDSVVIMQALIHRPREQIYQTLDVICELLPRAESVHAVDKELDDGHDSFSDDADPSGDENLRTSQRIKLLNDCKQQTRRFAMILLPTLTDAYSSTVNLSVRQKVLTAQLKILSNLETEVVEEALRPVAYASFLASILSQEDHPSLVMFALQASELLFERLENIYQYQFYREGVIGEIRRLASRSLEADVKTLNKEEVAESNTMQSTKIEDLSSASEDGNALKIKDDDEENHDDDEDDDDDDDDEGEDEEDEDEIIVRDEADMESESSESSDEDNIMPIAMTGVKDLVIIRARTLLESVDTEQSHLVKLKAAKIREDLQELASNISSHYATTPIDRKGLRLFTRLAAFFDGDALDSITSSELLDSGIIRSLIEVLTTTSEDSKVARNDFTAAFMGATTSGNIKTSSVTSPTTAFSILNLKLQDLLSRSEHFEVLTVNSSSAENSRSSSTSMLSRQIRLKLSADADSEIPPSFRDMIVSIHAIATFKALDDYLRPRMSLSERAPMGQRRRDMLQQLANARMAQLQGAADSGMFSPFGTELGAPPALTNTNEQDTSRSSKAKPNARPDEGTVEAETESKSRKPERASEAAAEMISRPAQQSGRELHRSTSKLECADETPMDDDDETQPADGEPDALEAIVGELEEEDSEDDDEMGAVNMEVGSSGKVTARQEDGTRVFTPQQPGTPVSGQTRPPSSQSPSLYGQQAREQLPHSRPSSYAAALLSTPQDWHIEFSIDGKVIHQDTTIYRAVHHNRSNEADPTGRGVWSAIHSIKFRKVKGPPPSASTVDSIRNTEQPGNAALPPSLDGHPITSSILSLLGILHDLNAGLDDIRASLEKSGDRLYIEPLASFINTKLTAKMNRQLEEPLIVASNCLPSWSEDLARTFPFLFPFETRHLFLQSTSFGYSRSIIRWQNNQDQSDDRRDRRRDDRPLMGRPQRQKVRISRSRILESAMKVMEMYGASPSVLEVEYFEEVGTGLGPTLEFYSTVSKEFSKKKLKMWRENDSNEKDPYAFGKYGLFPTPLQERECETEAGKKLVHFFKMLGKFVARSMLDSRIIDLNFSPTFFKIVLNASVEPSIALLRAVDPDLANSLSQLQQFVNEKSNIESDGDMTQEAKLVAASRLTVQGAQIEDLALDFTLPGYPNIELFDDGANTAVTSDNVEAYIDRVLDMSLGDGVRHQILAFQSGFSQVFSCSSLKAFTPNELVMLFGRVEEDWSIETLMDSIKADHGFNMDSKTVKNLLQVMSELNQQHRRDFLQFVTGSPKLPIGGFKSLTPMFTVVCKASEPPYTSDDYLPSVMTCVNYLKLPDYSSVEIMKQKLQMAIKEGQGAFHLS